MGSLAHSFPATFANHNGPTYHFDNKLAYHTQLCAGNGSPLASIHRLTFPRDLGGISYKE
jgi:hypothetical protein